MAKMRVVDRSPSLLVDFERMRFRVTQVPLEPPTHEIDVLDSRLCGLELLSNPSFVNGTPLIGAENRADPVEVPRSHLLSVDPEQADEQADGRSRRVRERQTAWDVASFSRRCGEPKRRTRRGRIGQRE